MDSDRMMKLGLKYMGLLTNERDKELGSLYDRVLNEPKRFRERLNGFSRKDARPFLSNMLTNILTKHL